MSAKKKIDARHTFSLFQNTAWYISHGRIDLFAIPQTNGIIDAPRFPLFSLMAGSLIWGWPAHLEKSSPLQLIAVPTPGSALTEIPFSYLNSHPKINQISTEWVEQLINLLHPNTTPHLIEPITTNQLIKQNQHATCLDQLCWVSVVTGHAYYLSNYQWKIESKTLVPLNRQSWLTTVKESKIERKTMSNLWQNEEAISAINHFQIELLPHLVQIIQQEGTKQKDSWQKQLERENQIWEKAYEQSIKVLHPDWVAKKREVESKDSLWNATKLLTDHLNIPLAKQPLNEHLPLQEQLIQLTSTARIRIRKIELTHLWYKDDHGPLLIFTDDSPAALLPKWNGRYQIYVPGQPPKYLSAKEAKKISSTAYIFYRTLPHKKLSLKELLLFSIYGRQTELLFILILGAMLGLLTLVPPITTGIIFDSIIPTAQSHQLLPISLILFSVAITSATFQYIRNTTEVRLKGKLQVDLETAVWERLISLPPTFFRQQTASKLANRVKDIKILQTIISKTIVTLTVTILTVLINFRLLFYYSPKLAIWGMSLMLVTLTISWILETKRRNWHWGSTGKNSSSIYAFHFLKGLSKLRTTGAEKRAFSIWLDTFSRKQSLRLKANTINNIHTTFLNNYPFITTIIFFMILGLTPEEVTITTGSFIAFLSTYQLFLHESNLISDSFHEILEAYPVYERIKPIFETVPEFTHSQDNPGTLSGGLEVSNLTFQYETMDTPLFANLSFSIEPGQFIAIVGPSGSGKSTILRVLLGFEKPNKGAIYYDGQDLAHLDLEALRKQIGVVLQDGKLLSGNIYQNISGTTPISISKAWEVAKQVKLAEEIEKMPMQMRTMLSENGSNISGGQRQRLLIARAIVHQPRILFFDEATSALDNETQQEVMNSLQQLNATRLVIAHRLSTVVHADKILVLNNGTIVQQGTFKQLISQKGAFSELIKRQLL